MIEPRMLGFLEPDDKDSWQDWARQHMEWHQRIYTEAVKQGFKRYDAFATIRDMDDLEGWAYFHNLEHANITSSIFIGEAADLGFIDPDDRESWDSWHAAHALIHAEIRDALKIVG
jgi:hypothetical protein